jgi:hypothetical protein
MFTFDVNLQHYFSTNPDFCQHFSEILYDDDKKKVIFNEKLELEKLILISIPKALDLHHSREFKLNANFSGVCHNNVACLPHNDNHGKECFSVLCRKKSHLIHHNGSLFVKALKIPFVERTKRVENRYFMLVQRIWEPRAVQREKRHRPKL